MPGRDFTPEQQTRCVVGVIGYALALVALLSVSAVGFVRGFPIGLAGLLGAVTVSVSALGLRYLWRTVSPLEPVEVPLRRW